MRNKKIPSKITRIGQLKDFSNYVKLNYKKQVKNNKLLKRNYILYELQETIKENNQIVKAPLKRFIKNYILKKNRYELDELWDKILRYTELLENSTFWEMNGKDYSDRLIHLVSYPDQYSIEEVLFELLYNFIYLPYYENQDSFNKQMEGILFRLENFLVKFFSNYNLIIKKTNAKNIYDIVSYTKGEEEIIAKEYIPDNSFIDKLDLYVYLPGFAKNKIDDGENEIALTYTLSYYPDDLSLRDIVLDFLENEYNVSSDGSFIIADYPELFIYANVSLTGLNEGIESSWGKKYFTISFTSKPKKLGKEENFYKYISDSLLYLEIEAMNFYHYFVNLDREVINYVSEKIKKGRKTKAILDKISVYFSENELISLNRLVSKDEKDNFIKEVRKIILNKFKGLRKSKLPTIIDFNTTIIEYLEDLENKGNFTDFSIKKTETNLEILEPVKAEVSIPKLFLEEETENKIKIIENYLKNMDKYREYLLKSPKGAILYGPPGVGKTESVKYLAKQTGLDVYKVDISSILNMYVGESEKRIKKMFNEFYKILENKKAILFIDEADGFFGKRDSSNRDLQNGVRSIALQELEGFAQNSNIKNGFIFLGTNFLDSIDKALRERFSFFLKYELPSTEKRKEYIQFMIDYISQEKKAKFENISIEKIAKLTNNWSYRALYNLFNNALQQVVILKGKIPPIITEQDIIDNLSTTRENENILQEKKMGFLTN